MDENVLHNYVMLLCVEAFFHGVKMNVIASGKTLAVFGPPGSFCGRKAP
jgi:hypothetical protein